MIYDKDEINEEVIYKIAGAYRTHLQREEKEKNYKAQEKFSR